MPARLVCHPTKRTPSLRATGVTTPKEGAFGLHLSAIVSIDLRVVTFKKHTDDHPINRVRQGHTLTPCPNRGRRRVVHRT